MDKLAEVLVTQIPNLAIAIWVIWQQQGTIKSLLSNQQVLIDRLLAYIDDDKPEALGKGRGPAAVPPEVDPSRYVE